MGLQAKPLCLHQELFLRPGQDLDLLEIRELDPTLVLERKVCVINAQMLQQGLGRDSCAVQQGSVGTVVHEYHFKPAMLELLPRKDRAWHYGTCAVVGNSGMLLKVTPTRRLVRSVWSFCWSRCGHLGAASADRQGPSPVSCRRGPVSEPQSTEPTL